MKSFKTFITKPKKEINENVVVNLAMPVVAEPVGEIEVDERQIGLGQFGGPYVLDEVGSDDSDLEALNENKK